MTRYELEQKKHTHAINSLIKLGLLIPARECEFYHGRASLQGEKWSVNPNFDNSGNATGNRNLNRISALSTSSKTVATYYAKQRQKQALLKNPTKKVVPMVAKIETINKDALILNVKFNINNLNENEQHLFYESLKVITNFDATYLSPVPFKDRFVASSMISALKKASESLQTPEFFYDTNAVEKARQILDENSIEYDYNTLQQIASSYNTRSFLQSEPNQVLLDYIESVSRINAEFKNKRYVYYINLEAVASFMQKNNIIGAKVGVVSGIIDKRIDNYFFPSLDQINTQSVVAQRLQSIMQTHSEFEKILQNGNENLLSPKYFSSEASNLLSIDDSATFMKKMSNLPNMKGYFSAPSGNWEGYSVGEHTEAVVEIFNNNYSQDMPEESSKLARLAIFLHDIEKGIAGKTSSLTEKVYEYNNACKALYQTVKVSPEIKRLATFIAKESQKYTTEYFVKRDISAKEKLLNKCKEKLEKVFSIPATDSEALGLCSICEALQNCDSGAYTLYAKIRSEKDNIYYRGGNEIFTQSFKPKDTTKTHFELKKPEEYLLE